MSIELQEARKKMDMIEKIENDPALILTGLFYEGIDACNFLYQINISSKYILDYLTDNLKKLDVFSHVTVCLSGHELRISVPTLKHGKYKEYQGDDEIMKIDLDKKVYWLCTRDIQAYWEVMNKNYELKSYEFPENLKKYKNYTFKNRMKAVLEALIQKKNFSDKLWGTIHVLFISRKKAENIVTMGREEVERINKDNLRYYRERIDLQDFYKKNAPEHIDVIHARQEEISAYLQQFGYKEDTETVE